MKTRTLTVSNSFWTAQCRWVFRYDRWECVIMDKQLNLLKGLTCEEARFELEKLGCKWQWGKVEDREPQTISTS